MVGKQKGFWRLPGVKTYDEVKGYKLFEKYLIEEAGEFSAVNLDKLAKSQFFRFNVIPAKAGIQ